MARVRKVLLPEDVHRILLTGKNDVNDLFLRRFQCTAEVSGPSQAAGSAPLKVYERRLFGWHLVSVWRDDLTRQDTDVVVNAANEYLEHWAGLAAALVKAGGQQIVHESKALIMNNGTLAVGGIAVTGAGTLPSKEIVHAVGPRWSVGTPDECKDQLREAIRKVLDHVNNRSDLQSVAIPAVSSGIFGFPLDLCAEIIVSTVYTFCMTEGKGHQKEIRLVNYDDKTVQAMKNACERICGISDTLSGAASSSYPATSSSYPATSSSYSATSSSYPATSSSYPATSSSYSATSSSYSATSSSYPATSSSYPATSSSYSATSSSYSATSSSYSATSSSYPATSSSYSATSSSYSATSSSYPATSSSYPATSSSVSLFINGLNLHLKTGCIEDEKTDVIVNSLGPSLELNRGVISQAIYRKAGRQMQDEIRKNSQRNWNPTMISTHGYNLPCRYVYHVILPGNQYEAAKALREVTKECLKTAHEHKSPSISFPALGTGLIGLPKDQVADIMTQSVLDFARQNQCKMDVYFVIHPRDTDTLKAFQDKFRRSEPINNNKTLKPTERRGAPEPPAEGMYVTITGESEEAVGEAEAWLQGVLSSSPLHIHNNLLLLFGGEEFDALASGADIEEDLSNGRVVLKISGPQPDKVMAAVQAERLLLDVQETLAGSLEEELLAAAVVWLYETQSEIHRYSAETTRELEKAFASGTKVTLSATPGHVIDMKARSAQEGARTFYIRRQCLHNSLQNIQTSPMYEKPLTEPVRTDSQVFRDRRNEFKKVGLRLEKMEKVQNKLLAGVFQSKKEAAEEKRQKKPSTEPMYQLVPRQFLRNICAAGFHRLYVTPTDTKYGVGVYFKKSLYNILERFQAPKEKDGLFYILQAEVVTGAATKYVRSDPVIPCKASDALQVYESVIDGGITVEHCAIFDRFQANPQYVFTCSKM